MTRDGPEARGLRNPFARAGRPRGRRRGPVKLLQGLVVLVGLAAPAFLLGEPHFEGRNAHATLFEIYFKDPFLAYVYAGSVPFFVALRQTFKALGLVGRGSAEEISKAVRTVKVCGLLLAGFIALGVVLLFMMESDDRAGGVAMGLVFGAGALAMAAAAGYFERRNRP